MLFKAGVLLGLAGLINAIDPVTVKGNAFFVGDERFYIRGLDYQPGGSSKLTDPLASTDICERDIEYFKKLGINTVRVYSIDNTANHDECMQKLADAGIYLIADVNIPYASIARDEGAACSYNSLYLEQVFATVLALSKYDNTLGFFAANEVINDVPSTAAAPYVKAVVRDMKTFLKNRDLRAIPVGYSAADIEENRLQSANYFNCGDDETARVDMFGFNDYSWCGKSSFTTSGYDQQVEEFSNYSLPLFFSEFGCNTVRPRPFTEVETIYSTKMSSVFSGGLVYEYSEEENNYGLVEISGSSVKTNDDFTNLQSEFKKTENPSGDGGYHNSSYSECPPLSDTWNASTTIPDTPKGALVWLKNNADPKGAGFDGNTQWACTDGNNNVDSSNSTTQTKSADSSTSATSNPSSSASSSSKKSNGMRLAESSSWINGAGLISFVAGMALL
jgi:hypothetical protein